MYALGLEKLPKKWHGMFKGHVKEPTMILEAVASQDLWIWHAFFGLLGSNNDLNVLQRSAIPFTRVKQRMWNEPLEFCNPVLPLSEDLRKDGNVKKSVMS